MCGAAPREIARRTHKTLKRAEVYVLFYMAAAAMAIPFEGLLYRQFLPQSKAFLAQGWQNQVPGWYAPIDPAIDDEPAADGGSRPFSYFSRPSPMAMQAGHAPSR